MGSQATKDEVSCWSSWNLICFLAIGNLECGRDFACLRRHRDHFIFLFLWSGPTFSCPILWAPQELGESFYELILGFFNLLDSRVGHLSLKKMMIMTSWISLGPKERKIQNQKEGILELNQKKVAHCFLNSLQWYLPGWIKRGSCCCTEQTVCLYSKSMCHVELAMDRRL